MLFIAYLVEEWIRRIEKVWRDGGGWWKLFRLKRQSSPPVFFTTSQPGTVINFLHLRFVYECCLDIRILFRACVMDDSIEMYELSSILQSLAIKSILKVTSIEISFQGNFWPLQKKKNRWIILFVHLICKFSRDIERIILESKVDRPISEEIFVSFSFEKSGIASVFLQSSAYCSWNSNIWEEEEETRIAFSRRKTNVGTIILRVPRLMQFSRTSDCFWRIFWAQA